VRVEGNLAGAVLSRVRAAGIAVIEDEPMVRLGATGYGPSIYVRDPDGYVVELKEENPA
jgi:catechol 2,3-dioxygenase-like lactoylglutathione lyase family enzyme